MELLKHKPVVPLMHAAVCVVYCCCCCYSTTQQTGYSDLQCGHCDAITTYTLYNIEYNISWKKKGCFQTYLETKNRQVIPVKHNTQGHKLSSKVVDVDTGKIGNVQIAHVMWRKVLLFFHVSISAFSRVQILFNKVLNFIKTHNMVPLSASWEPHVVPVADGIMEQRESWD